MPFTKSPFTRFAAICSLAFSMMACESAFEVSGIIDTSALIEPRALVVFLAEDPGVDSSGRALIDTVQRLDVLVADAVASAPSRSFRHLDQGCTSADTFGIVAWAPRQLPQGLVAGGMLVPRAQFAPMPGDPVAISQRLATGCTKSGAVKVDLILPPAAP